MKYLSFDIEATGLDEHDYIIEFAMVPFCSESGKIENSLEKHFFVSCPSFKELKPNLNPWVIKNNKSLIEKAHSVGIPLEDFKTQLQEYLESDEVRNYFNNEAIVLFGKSMNAIDLPFMNRDLGWEFMRKYFCHRVNDLSSYAYNLIDMNLLPSEATSGSFLMNYLEMGEVEHTALEDAVNTAIMYLKLLKKFSNQK